MLESVSIIVFTVLTGIVIIFQGCLAAGLPWGAASMGGKFPGKYPPKLRVVAIINILILCLITALVLSKADVIFPNLKNIANVGIWVVIVFFALGTILNTITPSKIERIWAPVAFLQLITALIIALTGL